MGKLLFHYCDVFTFQVKGTDYKTHDGTCIRDYIDVTDLVDAHVKALEKATPAKVGIYNVGTGKGRMKETAALVYFSSFPTFHLIDEATT